MEERTGSFKAVKKKRGRFNAVDILIMRPAKQATTKMRIKTSIMLKDGFVLFDF